MSLSHFQTRVFMMTSQIEVDHTILNYDLTKSINIKADSFAIVIY